jgi:hypothetical protein
VFGLGGRAFWEEPLSTSAILPVASDEVESTSEVARNGVEIQLPLATDRKGGGVNSQEIAASKSAHGPAAPIDFKSTYSDFSVMELDQARREKTRALRDLLMPQFREQIEHGDFIEVLAPPGLQEYMVPMSDTPGEDVMRYYRSRWDDRRGVEVQYWTFIQPSELSDEAKSLNRECKFLARECQAAEVPMPPHIETSSSE